MSAARLIGPGAGAAAFAATAGLAFDEGGFHPLSWDRGLIGFALLALLVLLVAGGRRPGRLASAWLAGLALLTAWTAASWLWSDAPPAALVEAQRTALYLAAALAVVAAGRRVRPVWIAGGVAAGVTLVGVWNLAIRLAPDWTGRAPLRSDIGALADPVGYANSLALLAVVGIVVLLGLAAAPALSTFARELAAAAIVPLAAVVPLQESTASVVALAAAVVALLLVHERPLRESARLGALAVLPLAGAAAVATQQAVVSPPPSDLTAISATGHRLILALALLTAAQAGVAAFAVPRLVRTVRPGAPLPGRAVAAVAAVLVAAGLAAAPVALRGHDRFHYWGVAVHEVASNPLLGSGAGTFVVWWLRLRTVALSTQEAHSLYLETLAELGPVGLLLLLTALGTPLVAALRLRRTPWGPPLLAALVAYDVHVAVDFDWQLAGVTVPVVLLAASAAVHASGRRARLPQRLAIPAVASLAALAAAGILALAGNTRLTAAQNAQDAGRFQAAAADARRALRYAPWSADAWKVIGVSRQALGDRAGASAAFRAALGLDSTDWGAWEGLAQVSAGEPRRSALAEAARLDPLGGSPQ